MPDQFDHSFDTELEEAAPLSPEVTAEETAPPAQDAADEEEVPVSTEASEEIQAAEEGIDTGDISAVETSFGTVTGRLSEIAEVLEDETLPLDDALDLLEEAVSLGMQASNLLETDMNERDAADQEAEEAAAAAEEALLDEDRNPSADA